MGSKLFTGNISGGMNFSKEMLLFLPFRSLTLIMTSPLVKTTFVIIFPGILLLSNFAKNGCCNGSLQILQPACVFSRAL